MLCPLPGSLFIFKFKCQVQVSSSSSNRNSNSNQHLNVSSLRGLFWAKQSVEPQFKLGQIATSQNLIYQFRLLVCSSQRRRFQIQTQKSSLQTHLSQLLRCNFYLLLFTYYCLLLTNYYLLFTINCQLQLATAH